MTSVLRDRAAFAALFTIAVGMASQANASTNLIVNGDFSAGNSGFTSGYAYVPQPASPATGPGSPPTSWNETTYGVGANADLYHSLWYNVPAPSGAGNYLIVNGGIVTPLATAWAETVTVTPNTWYTFTADFASIYPDNPATVDFYAGADLVGSYTPSGTPGGWGAFSGGWYSGSASSVTLSLVDAVAIASGDDFGVDNLAFGEAVPELSTWAMGALGFAALAFAGSRTRRTSRAIA